MGKGRNGEGGIRTDPFSQVSRAGTVRTQTLITPPVAAVLLVLVVCGYLLSLGDNLSTLSAQFPEPACLPRTATSASSRAGRTARKSVDNPATGIAASYSRYSSDLQDESSIDQQKRKCLERAVLDKNSILPELEFSDSAVSGTKRERAGLNAMMEAAKARRFSTVYFESLSRLARESVITMPMLKELVCVHRVRIV